MAERDWGQYVIIKSGEGVVVQSGVNVVGDFEIASGAITIGEVLTNISGQPVTISSGHVYVESGVHVVGDFTTEVASGLGVVIESGLGVIVGSGIGVVGDFAVQSGLGVVVQSGVHVVSEVDVSSGLHVMISGQHVVVESGTPITQSKEIQLQNYFISDIDESDEGIKFYGYMDAEGNWYIMQSTSGTTYRYASSGVYASNWIDRSGIGYQIFNQEF